MHYYRVPRLGSYLAIKMEFQSTLFEEAYDVAAENYIKVFNLNKQQEKDKKEFEEEQLRLQREAEENGEPFEVETKEWDEFKTQAFKSQRVQYVVCLNTMGQDRKFTEDEKNFAIETVKYYKECWANTES